MQPSIKKKLQIGTGIFFICFLLLAKLTNPDLAFHQRDIKQRVYQELAIDTVKKTDANLLDWFGEMKNSFTKSIVDKTVQELLTVDDYYFFSLTKISYQNQTKTIGIGAFRQLFLFVNLKEVIEEQQGKK